VNGVHDMGGMQDFGAIAPEPNEPVFHARWEGRVFALTRAVGALGKANIDAGRSAIESLPAVDYFTMSYYEKWFVRFVDGLVNGGLATRAEIDSGIADPGSLKTSMAPGPAQLVAYMAKGDPKTRNVPSKPRFRAGERVRARNINPATHTRLPRYARGKLGIVMRDRGVFVFPDSNALRLGEKPQHLYSVRFTARELWGDQAKLKDSVFLDMWDDYLEPG